MLENFQINSDEIDKIKKITPKEKNFRIKNLKFFQNTGFPNKKQEDWKFSDFQNIVNSNFDELEAVNISSNINKISTLKDFDHNYIFLVIWTRWKVLLPDVIIYGSSAQSMELHHLIIHQTPIINFIFQK